MDLQSPKVKPGPCSERSIQSYCFTLRLIHKRANVQLSKVPAGFAETSVYDCQGGYHITVLLKNEAARPAYLRGDSCSSWGSASKSVMATFYNQDNYRPEDPKAFQWDLECRRGKNSIYNESHTTTINPVVLGQRFPNPGAHFRRNKDTVFILIDRYLFFLL